MSSLTETAAPVHLSEAQEGGVAIGNEDNTLGKRKVRTAPPSGARPADRPGNTFYCYHDGAVEVLYQVVRTHKPKHFSQRRPDPDRPGEWIYDLEGVERVLYRLPGLRAANTERYVYVAEGEKDVDRLTEVGLVATCNSGGAGKWRPEFSLELAGRDVVILPDNDRRGEEHAFNVAESVLPHARSVRIVQLPNLPKKGDVSDYFDGGGSVTDLERLADETEPLAAKPAERTDAPSPTASPARSRGVAGHHHREDVDRALKGHYLELASELDLRLLSSRPDPHGWVSCRAIDRADVRPSASFNAESGYYIDHGSDTELSFYDLCMALDPSTYPDFCSTVDKLGDRFLGSRPAGLTGAVGAEAGPAETGPGRAAKKDAGGGGEAAETSKAEKESDAALLVRLGEEANELFHDQGVAYAWRRSSARRHCLRVDSERFEKALRRAFFEATGRVPSPENVRSAIQILAMKAEDGVARHVAVRVAEVGDRLAADHALYLDLGGREGHAVKISREGWEVVTDPPVPFLLPEGMLPLPVPEHGKSLEDLERFMNVPEDQLGLLLAFLTACYLGHGPYPLLVVSGEQGSAKSTLCRVVRELVDPNRAPLRNLPRGEQDLLISATHSALPVYDNISHLDERMSDALCRLATGGGFSTRRLYTNGEEHLINVCRPVVLNGIEDSARRGDLLQRAVLIELPSIPEGSRRAEGDFWKAFGSARPRVLGALLDLVTAALAALPGCKPERLPRMADFALWGEAVSRARGNQPGTFLKEYRDNQAMGRLIELEASMAALELLRFAQDVGNWEGTATQLLDELNGRVDPATRRSHWPTSPSGLGGIVSRVSPALQHLGVYIKRGKDTSAKRTRMLSITVAQDATAYSGD